jgi:hypothetical protein
MDMDRAMASSGAIYYQYIYRLKHEEHGSVSTRMKTAKAKTNSLDTGAYTTIID